MMAAFTYTKPVVGGSEDAWGDTLNANWDALGAFIGSVDSTELAVLDGITATTAELNFVDGVTSAIQTQIDDKQPLDADLTAVAGLATSGLVARTGAGTAAARSIAVSGLATIADGDAVAGNPTVGVPAASQEEAEAGTDNTKVMTPLRVEQAIVDRFNVSGSAPTYACRAWVRCSALGVVLASGNVSSVSRVGTGSYVINFETAMQDINYSVTGSSQQGNDESSYGATIGVSGRSTSSFSIRTRRSTDHDSFNSGFDIAIFR
jgi:hypothetical protein